jgi:hypothetical protein
MLRLVLKKIVVLCSGYIDWHVAGVVKTPGRSGARRILNYRRLASASPWVNCSSLFRHFPNLSVGT